MAAEASRDLTQWVRPRSLGEILDDSWRLYQADGSALLLLSSLFLAPAFAALLWLVAGPVPVGLLGRLLWPLVTAVLLCLTGLGSGACQEWLRRRTVGETLSLSGCLAAALRRFVGHLSIRAIGIAGIVLGLGCLLLPGLTLWCALAPVHAALAATRTGSLGDVPLGREARFDATKAAGVIFSRVPILLLALVNLILLVQVGLWIAGNCAGLDVALLSIQLSAISPVNPVFLLAATLFCWLLLAPYFEASSFLLYLDTRVRQEGLDLLHRVQRAFATQERRIPAAILLGMMVFLPSNAAFAQEQPPEKVRLLKAVRDARAELKQIRKEVESADPYPGGQKWEARLEEISDKLEDAQPGRARPFRWLHEQLDSFPNVGKTTAIEALTEVEQRLLLVEENLSQPIEEQPGEAGRREDVKQLLRPRDEAGKPAQRPARQEARRERDRKQDQVNQRRQQDGDRKDQEVPVRRRAGGGLIAPMSGDVGPIFWMVLGGIALAVVAALLWAWWKQRSDLPAQAKPPEETAKLPAEAPAPAPQEQTPTAWFRQAEELARAGQFKEAVRALFHAILSLLHRQQLLRCAATRTNGEYLREIRLAANAPAGLPEPFERLTRRFDRLWYGDREGTTMEYSSCRELAEEVRQAAGTN